MSDPEARPVRIANCSGFFGDRIAAAREQVEGGPIDVLTGDWLAELTMLILARQRLKHGPGSGYARTFLTQLEQVLGTCLDRGIRVVSNAGGLDPAGCAEAVGELATRLGLHPSVAYVDGDDLMPRMAELTEAGNTFTNMDGHEPFASLDRPALTANAYVGGFGIAAALGAGADVVVTGRVTDASLVVGPAAWWHGWSPDDLDELAGAVVAGHVIECGAQATGGNYAFFAEVPGIDHVAFPIAEVAADGSSVITKHEGTGGMVSLGTVTAQLLYEIGAPAYANPDVTARFDSIALAQQGPDRVTISGVRGTPPPLGLKVAVNAFGGFRNEMTLVLTGLDLTAKAELVERQLWAAVPGGRQGFDSVDVQLLRRSRSGEEAAAADEYQSQAELRIIVRDRDAAKLGKAFTAPAVELALASVPGLYLAGPPAEPAPYGVYWPTTIGAELVTQRVMVDGVEVGPVAVPTRTGAYSSRLVTLPVPEPTPLPSGPTTRAPLGRVFGARSGDKGGNASIGVWARDSAAYAWLAGFLSPDRVRELIPEAAGLRVEVHLLPNLLAVNLVLHGILGRGVADSTSVDPQGKGLGEYLRARVVDLPTELLGGTPS